VLGDLLIRNLRICVYGIRPHGVPEVDVARMGPALPWALHGICCERPSHGCNRPRRILHGFRRNGPPEHAYRALLCGMANLPGLDWLLLGGPLEVRSGRDLKPEPPQSAYLVSSL